MEKRKQSYFRPDPRTWLLLCLLGIASILLVHSEIGGLCLFLGCLLIHLLSGNANKILPYMLYYIVFYGIGWAGVRLLDSSVAFSVSSMLSSIGIVGRKILIPLSFATALAREATGSLMAALQAMRFPKAVGIAASVVLRFFPTISGEYRAIRSSQRFRGNWGRRGSHAYPSSFYSGIYLNPADFEDDKGGRRTIRVYDGARRAFFR